MRHLLTILLISFTLTLSAQWGNRSSVKGNGDVTTASRSVDGFDGVSTCCDIDVLLVKGNFSVKVEAESNLQEHIKTDVVGGRLEIGFKGDVNIRSHKQITVYVSLPELEYVGASSSGTIKTESSFSGERMEADVSSGARITLDYSGGQLYTNASSGGNMTVRGSSDRFKANVSSGGKVDAEDYQAREARCNASSGGGVVVRVSDELEANASSGGRIRYTGNPSDVDSNTSSGGTIRRGN
ncbi:DUF2807 domain-containing protein [Neolewinella aurantiaca]|uniref:DUF2807 domain-containing protein n=1 Tax=Neolewinella aurantiaca TaxID=2602767 RepID=A0A5C7FPM1_9BACT|nr:head GIN domain-containing protein [Neolewinella aurantiaca]TXF86685.1 DUF2807 domain-containing protein [Neolewinella aurantiaca]